MAVTLTAMQLADRISAPKGLEYHPDSLPKDAREIGLETWEGLVGTEHEGLWSKRASLFEQVLAVATARVLRYAPEASDGIHDEAVTRFGGYILWSDYGGVSEETVAFHSEEASTGSLTSKSVKRPTNHAAAFRNSGAAGLLAPWRTHRAGRVGRHGVRLPWARVERRESSYTDTLVDLIVTRATGETAKATATGALEAAAGIVARAFAAAKP